jgi:hypothetical protein
LTICGAEARDAYLGHLHRCSFRLQDAPCDVHRCALKEGFGECGYSWMDGFRTNALEDWRDCGWRIDRDYKGPPIETLERSTEEEILFGGGSRADLPDK